MPAYKHSPPHSHTRLKEKKHALHTIETKFKIEKPSCQECAKPENHCKALKLRSKTQTRKVITE